MDTLGAHHEPRRPGENGPAPMGLNAPMPPALEAKLAEARAANPRLEARLCGSLLGVADASGAGYDASLGAMLRARGFSYAEMRAVLLATPHGEAADHADDERYFKRIWNQGAAEDRAARRSISMSPEPPIEAYEADAARLVWGKKGADKAPREPLPLLFFPDIAPDLAAVTDFVEGLLEEGSSAVIYGESNSGKTFFATDLALHIAAGMEWRGRQVAQGGVLYAVLEGSAGFKKRVEAWRREVLDDYRDVHFAAVPSSLDLRSPDADTGRLIDAAHVAAKHFGCPLKLIVVDTLARAMAGGNENAAEDMGALVGNMDRIRAETGACVLFIHHSGKDTAKGARGHSSLRGALDTEIEVTATEGAKARNAHVSKQRELESGQDFPFELRVVELGENARGSQVTSCVVVASDEGGRGRGPRLSGRTAQALSILADLIQKSGQQHHDCPQYTASVPDKWWRERFYDRAMPAEEQEAKQKAFKRASEALVQMRKVGLSKGRVWIIAE